MSRFVLKTKMVVLALVLVVAGQARADGAKPTLYMVSVGISKFQSKGNEGGVMYAAKDARDVAEMFKKQEGKLFDKVECMLLTDKDATRANIVKALGWLKTKATADSQVIVFLAGHGGPDPLGEYFYVTHDSHRLLPSTNVTGRMLADALQRLPGKRLLMLDTCHAGGFAGKNADFITLAACSAQETSGEMVSTQNGYFTNVLLDGLSGKADLDKDGVITMAEINSFVKGNLLKLTAGRQHATLLAAEHLSMTLPLVQAGTVTSVATAPKD
jgi:uncharacterized caspase-like protein